MSASLFDIEINKDHNGDVYYLQLRQDRISKVPVIVCSIEVALGIIEYVISYGESPDLASGYQKKLKKITIDETGLGVLINSEKVLNSLDYLGVKVSVMTSDMFDFEGQEVLFT